MSERGFGDVFVSLGDDFVGTVELRRPPNNFFDVALIRRIVEAYEFLDTQSDCRAILLCSEGKHFCAGADFGRRAGTGAREAASGAAELYAAAAEVFRSALPVVAAVQGAAIGGGLGLACSADFRVGCPESRFAANFARLGFHHGFGLSITLPAIVGQQHALDLLYSGRRVGGEEAFRLGLCDRLVPQSELRETARLLAAGIVRSAPLAVRSIRKTMRAPVLEQVEAALAREGAEQEKLRQTQDFREGVTAAAERREPHFEGR